MINPYAGSSFESFWKEITMQVRRFDKRKDTKIVAKWLQSRHLPAKMAEELPHLGFIAFCDNGDPVAAGFLRSCEDKCAIADSFITNPDESPEIRDIAMDAVLTEAIRVAKELNLTSLIAYSLDNNTIKRSQRHGFQVQPHTVLSLKLKENK